MGDDIDPLLRRHLGELVEVIARYLEPWVSKGELRCASAKTLVLSLIAIILSHRSLHRLFAERRLEPGGALQGLRGAFGVRIGNAFSSTAVHAHTARDRQFFSCDRRPAGGGAATDQGHARHRHTC